MFLVTLRFEAFPKPIVLVILRLSLFLKRWRKPILLIFLRPSLFFVCQKFPEHNVLKLAKCWLSKWSALKKLKKNPLGVKPVLKIGS